MHNLPPKCHKDIFKLQRIGHLGPFDPNASRISVLRLMVETAGQSDGATAVCHHFTRSCLHNHSSRVILCGKKEGTVINDSVINMRVNSLLFAVTLDTNANTCNLYNSNHKIQSSILFV